VCTPEPTGSGRVVVVGGGGGRVVVVGGGVVVVVLGGGAVVVDVVVVVVVVGASCRTGDASSATGPPGEPALRPSTPAAGPWPVRAGGAGARAADPADIGYPRVAAEAAGSFRSSRSGVTSTAPQRSSATACRPPRWRSVLRTPLSS